jgi:hypothetical protein
MVDLRMIVAFALVTTVMAAQLAAESVVGQLRAPASGPVAGAR